MAPVEPASPVPPPISEAASVPTPAAAPAQATPSVVAAPAPVPSVPSPAARLGFSVVESVADGGPQQCVVGESGPVNTTPLPGTTATVSLVGVVSRLGQTAIDEGNDLRFTQLEVKYTVPLPKSRHEVHVEVRCYGDVLSGFACSHVAVGDTIHVLGHLMPLTGGPSVQHSFAVCALPLGGNITVLLPSLL